MKLTYYYSSDPMRKPLGNKFNEGIESVLAQLTTLRAMGHDVELVEISGLTERDRIDAYERASLPAVYRRYKIKRAFGSNRHSACWFGAEAPALLVTDVDPVGDTYPHRKGNRIQTIHDFLTGLLASRTDRTN